MDKIIIRIGTCFVLVALVAPKGFAVWPPETMLDEERNAQSAQGQPTSTDRNSRQVINQLAEDERRLDIVLGKLEKNQDELKKLLEAEHKGDSQRKESGNGSQGVKN